MEHNFIHAGVAQCSDGTYQWWYYEEKNGEVVHNVEEIGVSYKDALNELQLELNKTLQLEDGNN